MKKIRPKKKFAWFISISLHQCFFFMCATMCENEKKKKGEYSVRIFSFCIENIPNF
jgi:hypothetical protein